GVVRAGGHVGDTPSGTGPGQAVLVGRPGVQPAVTARGGVGAAVPGHLAVVGATGAGRAQDRAADRQHQRVGGGQADLHGRPVVADGAVVAGGGDDRDVLLA